MHPKTLCCAVVLGLLTFSEATAAIVFSDDFQPAASGIWGNEVGNWTSAGGVYSAQAPHASPPTFTSLPFDLADFTLEVDIFDIGDGGIWLRSTDGANGVLLVTGGNGWWDNPVPGVNGRALYWHVFVGGVDVNGGQGFVDNVFQGGVTDATIRVEVSGLTYAAYVNDVLVTSIVDTHYTHGRVGLYDSSSQYFDNFTVAGREVPEPAGALGVIVGLVITMGARRRTAGA